MSDRRQYFRIFALYNRWANGRLYEVAGECSPQQLHSDRGAFFKSILGTLNHLVVADKMWLDRLRGQSPLGVKLDEVLHHELAALREARRSLDQEIVEYTFQLTDTEIAEQLHYETSSGAAQSQPLEHVLAHFFNHQAHHRGQAHDLLAQTLGASKTPVLDLLYYQRVVAQSDQL